MSTSTHTSIIPQLIIDILLIIVGISLFFGAITIPDLKLWLPLGIAFIGLLILSSKPSATSRTGLILFGLGIFILLRDLGIVSTPWLRYGLATFLIATGVVNIIRNSSGRKTRLGETFLKPTDKN